MIADERRSAHLLFAGELASGRTTLEQVLATREVQAAVRSRAVPSPVGRTLQRLLVKRGALGYEGDVVAPFVAARRAVLGADAAGPPRFLVRMDEFPHAEAGDKPDRYGTPVFERFDAILRDAGVPYLVAVMPRVPHDYLDPDEQRWRAHDAEELRVLDALRRDPGVAIGVHGLDHRTRKRHPRHRTELGGLRPDALKARLDTADQVLRDLDLPTDVLVAPFNRYDAGQAAALARRYAVLTGGPESIGRLGFHRTPLWRDGAVHLPCYAPLYGRAREVRPAVARLAAERPGLWIPIVLHLGWEADEGFTELEALAHELAGLARPWSDFMSAVDRSRAAGAAT